ncbi:hypothetical protein CTEN210_15547 [Chaetoceros tenuissimus]|uniref:Arf-GAP domain-containing protein n=1 Tax=Chaetoceros tenuissimus TaxID=426638 RepID=A0AAD3HDC7_9STRA|nr:hypothetical protein CTEN210_15547 [Chaetoceros tenuissimus]
MNLDYDGRRDYSLANRERSRSRGRSFHEREVNVGYDSLMSNQPDINMSRNSRSMSTPRHLVQDPISLEQKSRSAIPLMSDENDFELQLPNDVQLRNTNNSMSRSSHRRSSSVHPSFGNRSSMNGEMRERGMGMDHKNRNQTSLPVAIPLHMNPLDNTVRDDLKRSKSRSRSRGRSRGRSSNDRDARSKSRGRSINLQDEEKSASLRPSNRNSSYHSLASEFMALANAMNNALEGKPSDESKTQHVDERPVSRRKSRSKSMSRRMSRMNLDEDEQTVLPSPSRTEQPDPISMTSYNSNSRNSRRSLSISHHQPSTNMKRNQSERYFNGTSRGMNVSKSFHDFASVQDKDNGVRSLNQDRQGPSQRDFKIAMNSMAFDSLPRLKQERRTSKLSRRSSSRIRSSSDMNLLTPGPKHVSPFFNDSDHSSMFKPRSNERINPMEVPEKADVEKKPKFSSSASVKSFTSSKGKKSYSRYVSIESIQKELRPHYPDDRPPSSFKDFDAWMEHCRDIIALRRRSKIAPNRKDPLRPMVQEDSLKYKPTNDISFMCDIERENNLIGFKPSSKSEEQGISPFLAAVTQLKEDSSNSHLLDTSMKNLLSIVKLLPGNERCCDCGRFDGETPSVKILWASVSHATLLCGECAFRHVTDGLQQSNIKSFGEDGDTNWNVDEVLTMLEGCNDAFQSYILKQNKKNNRSIMYGGLLSCTNGKLKHLYESTIVRQYRKDLAKKALKQRDSMAITRS